MRRGLHPYALILGVAIGFMVMIALRHPLVALMSGIISVILIDIGFKKNSKNDET